MLWEMSGSWKGVFKMLTLAICKFQECPHLSKKETYWGRRGCMAKITICGIEGKEPRWLTKCPKEGY
jgi:hypothetical protein